MRRRRTRGSLATDDRDGLAAALAEARQALSAAPAGLLTDLDGTLAPIVAIPDQARPVAGAVAALGELAAQLAVVGVVSGRSARDARRILGKEGERLLVIGNHGLEWLEPGAEAPTEDPSLAPARTVVAAGLAIVPSGDGIAIEDKGLSATIHYRRAPDPAAARDRILRALAASPAVGVEVREGRRSVELRPAGLGDKGTAVRRVVARFGLRGLLVAGDDRTDLDMFDAARDLVADGRLRAAILAVAGGREVPPDIAAAADAVLGSPAAFASALQELASQLGGMG